MIIKSIDDRRPAVNKLKSFLLRSDLTISQREAIEQNIRNIELGYQGEKDAAHEINFYYGDTKKNYAVIHDLRIEHEGRVAQIDHLLINRFLEIYVCESKNFSEGIAYNEKGEFTNFSNQKPYGIASPIEQNKKHIEVIKSILKNNVIPSPERLGLKIPPKYFSLILISKNGRITRPEKKTPDCENIIKVDQIKKRIDKELDSYAVWEIGKVVSKETVIKFGNDIASLHKPLDFNWEAKFGIRK